MAQCNADWCFRETGETWQSIPTDRFRSTGVLTGPDWLRMGLYHRDAIVNNNIKFIVGLLSGQQNLCLTRCVHDIPSSRYINIIYIIRQ